MTIVRGSQALKHDRVGQHSIRINDKWRLCFVWREDGAYQVESKLSADIDVSPSRISDIVHGQRPITADTALRLGMYFSMEPRFWINLQSEYDMRITARDFRTKIAPRIRVFQP